MTSQRTVFVTTLTMSIIAVLYRNIDLRRGATLDAERVKLGLASDVHDQRMSAAASALLFSGLPQFRGQVAKSGIPGTLIEVVRSAPAPANSSAQFVALCTHALARVCGSNTALCKKLLKSHDLVGMSFKRLHAEDSYPLKAAAISLLAALGPHSRMVARRVSQPEVLASMVQLLQMGAATQAEELVVSVSELLAFGTTVEELRPKIIASGAIKTWLQVALAHNNSAGAGASIAALDAVASYEVDVVEQLMQSGMPAVLVQATKEMSNMTTGPALALSIRLAEDDMGRWSLVNGNALSICAQMWYSGKVQYRWRLGCTELLLTVARLGDLREQIPVPKQVLASLMTLARDVEHPAMQSAALDAIRDIAHLRAAALNMAERSVISSIISILATTAGRSADQGRPTPLSDRALEGVSAADEEAVGWRLRSRRAIAATLALISVHEDLREEVLAAQGAEALVAIIHATPGMGLPAQVRVASAAALIALGQGAAARRRIVAAGAIPALLQTYSSPASRQEQETAAAALKLLRRDPQGAEELLRHAEL